MRSVPVALPVALPVAFAFALAACSGTSGSSAGPRPGADSGSAKPSATCEAGPGYAGPRTVTPFSHLSATVVDLDGRPAGKVTAQACGVNICLNGTTDAQGFIAIDQTANMTRPAFKYGGGQNYARFALPLGTQGNAVVDVDLGEQRTAAFDSPEMGAPLTPGAQATSRGVTLTLAKSTAVAVDPFDYATPDLKKFRATEIPIANAPAAVDAALGLELVVALTPAGTTFCPRAGLSVPNTPGWPAGSRVEFFLHGVEVTEEFAPYGGWAKVSDGAVSADGKTVETDAAGAADGAAGLPVLSVVGARLAR